MPGPSFPQLLRRQYRGPIGNHIRGFTRHLRRRGLTSESASQYVSIAAHLNRWMQERGLRPRGLRELDLSDYLQNRSKSFHRRSVSGLRALMDYLRQVRALGPDGPRSCDVRLDGGLPRPQPPDSRERRWITPASPIERDFEQYLQQERGIARSTQQDYLHYVRRFLAHGKVTGRHRWRDLRAGHVTAYVLHHAHDHGPGSAKAMVKSLRHFLRFLYLRSQTPTNLSMCVPSVATWRMATLPKFLKPPEVERLLRQCDRETSVGRRDFAILLLIARLGLRAGEVSQLTLEDVNWASGQIVLRGKGSRVDPLPLSQELGQALSAYLRKDRPRCPTREIFVQVRKSPAPFSDSGAISAIVRRRLAKAGLNPPRKGAHVLRHSLATHLLARGASLAEIGQVLRHQHLQTTTLYAKVDLARLRPLALRWPGGLV